MVSNIREKFYVRGSGGYFTNLQLFALRRALSEWKSVEKDFGKKGEDVEQLRERCVFIIATVGLSLSQLLGQNNPDPPQSRTPRPKELFEEVASKYPGFFDQDLRSRFDEFIGFYDATRHFGITQDDSKYRKILDLDFTQTQRCVETGLEIWRQVIRAFDTHAGTQLGDLRPDIFPDDDEFVLETEDS